jgi:hypothetical protein
MGATSSTSAMRRHRTSAWTDTKPSSPCRSKPLSHQHHHPSVWKPGDRCRGAQRGLWHRKDVSLPNARPA